MTYPISVGRVAARIRPRPEPSAPAWRHRLLASLLGTLALSAASGAAPVRSQGIVPQGLWVLNPARSESLNPGRQTLWVIKDDGKHLVWVSVIIDDQHRAKIITYDGAYGGPAAPVEGTPMQSQLVATGPSTLHNFGEIAGMGAYAEDCRVFPGGRRFRCEGQVTMPEGVKRYVDDFDWFAASPPAARP